MLWAVLSPLGMVLILYLLFSLIVPLDIPHYAAFIYSALLPWTWFQSAVYTGSATLIDNRDLVRTPFFTRPLLPVVVTTSHFLLYLLALPILLVLVLFDGVGLSVWWFSLPFIWLVQAVVTLAFTMLVAVLGALNRDTQHLLGLGMLLWFYLTPIFYNLNAVPDKVAIWFALNPLAVLIQAYRAVTLYHNAPNITLLAIWFVAGSILLALSIYLFNRLEDSFIEVV